MDWKKKLTSRKLWAAIASFVSMMIMACNGGEAQAAQVTAIIMAGASVIAYIIGEGLVDASNVGNKTDKSLRHVKRQQRSMMCIYLMLLR